jgi:hypothetical protein
MSSLQIFYKAIQSQFIAQKGRRLKVCYGCTYCHFSTKIPTNIHSTGGRPFNAIFHAWSSGRSVALSLDKTSRHTGGTGHFVGRRTDCIYVISICWLAAVGGTRVAVSSCIVPIGSCALLHRGCDCWASYIGKTHLRSEAEAHKIGVNTVKASL